MKIKNTTANIKAITITVKSSNKGFKIDFSDFSLPFNDIRLIFKYILRDCKAAKNKPTIWFSGGGGQRQFVLNLVTALWKIDNRFECGEITHYQAMKMGYIFGVNPSYHNSLVDYLTIANRQQLKDYGVKDGETFHHIPRKSNNDFIIYGFPEDNLESTDKIYLVIDFAAYSANLKTILPER